MHRKLLLTGMLVVLLPLLVAFPGCSKKVILFPLEQADIVLLQEGETVTAPKQGAFLSDFYIEEVMKARIGE